MAARKRKKTSGRGPGRPAKNKRAAKQAGRLKRQAKSAGVPGRPRKGGDLKIGNVVIPDSMPLLTARRELALAQKAVLRAENAYESANYRYSDAWTTVLRKRAQVDDKDATVEVEEMREPLVNPNDEGYRVMVRYPNRVLTSGGSELVLENVVNPTDWRKAFHAVTARDLLVPLPEPVKVPEPLPVSDVAALTTGVSEIVLGDVTKVPEATNAPSDATPVSENPVRTMLAGVVG